MARVRRAPGWGHPWVRPAVAAATLVTLAGLTLVSDQPDSQPRDAVPTSETTGSAPAESAGQQDVPQGCGYDGAAGGGGYTGGAVRCGPDDPRRRADPADELPDIQPLVTDHIAATPA